MRIWHRIFNNWTKAQVLKLEGFGIEVNPGPDSFEIEENEKYYLLEPLLKSWNTMDNVNTRFTKKEIKIANYSQLYASWLNDYPQPEDEYLKISYDLTNYCNECGIGRQQKAPLRIKKEPKWSSRKKVFGLNWIFDVLLVQKEWYEQVFKPLGIKSRPVIINKKDVPAESVVQLILPEVNSQLNLENYPKETCTKCGRTKYLPITKGFFPTLKAGVNHEIFISNEYVGSGGSANKWIIVNKELKDKLLEHKFNVDLHPLG